MASPGGYQIHPGLYRVPDLLTEEQFVDYMKGTYGRTVEFTDGFEFNPARSLGQSHNIGLPEEVDKDGTSSPVRAHDSVLKQLNEMDFRSPEQKEADEEKAKEEDREEGTKTSSTSSTKSTTTKSTSK